MKGVEMRRLTVLLLCSVFVSGCSVGMAMSGKKTPDLGVVKQGASRGEIELQLGPPISVTTLEDNHVSNIYEFEVGNDPSAGRAAGHAVMDVLTIGFWELIGTPIEGFQGETRYVQIEYDENDKIVAVKGSAPPTDTK